VALPCKAVSLAAAGHIYSPEGITSFWKFFSNNQPTSMVGFSFSAGKLRISKGWKSKR